MGFTSGFDVVFVRDVVQLCPKRRRSLLLGTALGSTLAALSASPSFAANCTQPASPSPITVNAAAPPISCTNTVARAATVAGDNAIGIVTAGNGNIVDITNSGLLTTASTSLIPGPTFSQSTGARGIYAGTNGIGADITINNTGTINSYSDSIKATDAATSGTVFSSDTHITITNSGNLTAGPNAEGIYANASYGSNNVVTIDNSGAIQTGASASQSGASSGIFATVDGDNSQINIANSGAISTIGGTASGISAIANHYYGDNGSIVIDNKAAITTTGAGANGILAQAGNPDNGGTVKITNAATVSAGNIGIASFTNGAGGNITIDNKGTITAGTSGANVSDGIMAVAYGSDATITITNSGAIDTTAGGHRSVGIEATAGYYDSSNAHISVTNTASITTGAYSEGILARSYGTGATVTIDNSGAINAGSLGIVANVYGDSSQISVTNSGAITTTDPNANGITAVAISYGSSGDSIVIDNKAGGTIDTSTGTFGIFALAGSNGNTDPDNGGTITITNAATINSGHTGIAAITYGNGGAITVSNSAAITAGKLGGNGSYGILAVAIGSDIAIDITNSGAIDTTAGGPNATGIQATGTYSSASNVHISVTNSASITTAANSEGIFAQSYGDGGMVAVDNSGAIRTGDSTSTNGRSSGMAANVNGDNSQISVTNSGAITTIGVGANGITAIANLYGTCSCQGPLFPATSNGSIVISNKAGGTITTTGSDASGIFAQAGNKDPSDPGNSNPDDGGTISLANAAVIRSGAKGIAAGTYGAGGTISVTNSGDIVSTAGEGLYAKSSGDNSSVTVANTAFVKAKGGVAGLAAYTSGSGSNIVIVNSGHNAELFSSVGFGAIAGATGASSTVLVTNDGKIHGQLGGLQVSSSGGSTVTIGTSGFVGANNNLAIKSTAGTTRIDDAGVIAGRVELSDAGNVMSVNDAGIFRAFTDSKFGAGADALNNLGTLYASGSFFGSSPGTVSFIGLENFVNGSLGSGAGLTTMIDGVAGDRLTTSGNFTGQGNSKLGVDANFTTGVADTLTIGGNSSGHTDLVVNVVGAGAPAVFIPVVTVTGTTADSDFDLAGPVNAGFFTYGLFLQGNTHGLRSIGLDNAGFELPAGVTGAQDVWLDTTGFWQDRMADLRTQESGVHNADMPEEKLAARMGGLWARASGDWSNRDSSVSYTDPVSLQSETLNLDRKQRTGAFLGGIDMGLEGIAGGDMLFGVMGGYVTSRLDFKATDDSWNYKGGTVGAYATYLNGGFYLDGLVKADFLDVDINDVGGKASTNATNIGARLDAGYRVAMGWGFIEPQASLEWVRTNMDSVSLFGGDIDFQNGSSGRARIGVRIGTDMQMNDMTVSPDLTLSVWNHFGDSNAVDINFPGSAFSAIDSAGNGTFGEVGVGVNVASASNWSGVVRGSVRFGDNYSAGSVGAALRYGW